MAVYQSFGYGSEKTAVIFDVGSAYTKVGFVGENGPRSIIASKIKDKSNKERGIYDQSDDEEKLYDTFVDFFHVLYFRHLLVNPKERRVVVVESILTPSVFRNIIAKVLFKHYEVPSLLFAPSHLVSLLTLGIPSALVVDVGFKETLALPVYEGVLVLKAWQSLPLGGKAIHSCIEANLLENASITHQSQQKPLSSVMDKVKESILEDIKVRCCFVTKYDRAQKIQAVSQGKADSSKAPAPPPGVDYPIDGDKILHIDGKLRENTCEVLFEQDNEEQSVATLIMDSILQCPVDTRRTLASNLVVTGGTAMLPGFTHRLLVELRAISRRDKYKEQTAGWKFVLNKPPAKANYVSWLGGAIFGSLEILASRSIALKTYLEQGTIPDWCSLELYGEENETERPLATTSTVLGVRASRTPPPASSTPVKTDTATKPDTATAKASTPKPKEAQTAT